MNDIGFSKRYIMLTCAVILAYLVVIVSLWKENNANIPLFITVLAAISTIYFTVIKYWLDADNIFKSLFEKFNERFDSINNELNAVVHEQHECTIGDQTPEGQEIMQKYLNLCAEEFYWYKKGRIPKGIWMAWHEGIREYTQCAKIDAFFKTQLEDDKSYYGFLSYFYR